MPKNGAFLKLKASKYQIAQKAFERYAEQNLLPSVKREGWDLVILSTLTWFSRPGSPSWNGDLQNEKMFFLSNDLIPTPELLRDFEQLTTVLENWPDGFLAKLKKTGKSESLKVGLAEIGARPLRYSLSRWGVDAKRSLEDAKRALQEQGFVIEEGWSFDIEEHDQNERLQVVDGEIEMVEVKSGKAHLPPHQVKSYANAVRKGFTLRYFHIESISSDGNEFVIREKLIRDPIEIKAKIHFD